MNANLRQATVADLGELTEIAHESKRRWNYPESLISQWSSTLTFDESSLADMHVVVADGTGSVDGFCAVVPGPVRYQLEHLWVRPRAMGRGLGRALLEYATGYSRSQGAEVLVIEADPNAEPFYERMGAVRVDAVPAPIPDDPGRVLPILEIALGDTSPGEAAERTRF